MKKLRQSIRKLILEYIQNDAAVEKLNVLIDAANEGEAQWDLSRWDRENPYAEYPDTEWNQIIELMHAFDWVDNPPRNLKCWYIIELPDGEINRQSRWQTYDQVVAMAEELEYTPADPAGNPRPDGPAEDGGGLFYI